MNWFKKSEKVWKKAFSLLNEQRFITCITETGVYYRTVDVLRYARERRRKEIAYRLASKDGFKRHPDYYWHESLKVVIEMNKQRKL